MASITKKSFIRQNIFGTSAEFIAFLMGIFFNIIFPLMLGAALFGELTIALGFAFLIGGIFQDGFNRAIVRSISKHLSKNNFSKINSYFRYIFKLKLGFYLLLSISVFLLSGKIAEAYSIPSLKILLQLSALLILINSVTSYLRSTFIALRKAQYSFFSTFLSSVLRIIIPFLLLLIGLSVLGVMIGIVLAYVFALILLFVLLKVKYGKKFRSKKVKIDTKNAKSNIFNFTSVSASNSMVNWGILLILGFFAGSANAGFFRISLAWILAIINFIPISSMVIFSSFTGMTSRKKLKIYIEKTLAYTAIIAVPASVGLYVLGEKLIALVYGPEFFLASVSLSIISLAMFPVFINRVLFSAIISINKVKQASQMFLIGTGAGLVMAVVFSSMYGLKGASFSFLFTVVLLSLVLWFYTKKYIDFSSKKIIIKPVIASVIMGAVIYHLKSFAMSIGTGVALILLGAVIYFAVLYSIKGISKKDLKLINYLRG